ncbi:thioredoxin 1-like, partial [Hibiscus syriacus]
SPTFYSLASLTESMAGLSSTLRFGNSVSLPTMMISRPAVSLSSRRLLPEFKGLRIQSYSTISSAPSDSRYPRVSNRRGRFVCEAQETTLDIPAVTDETWQSLVLKADGPVLVEFWAPWCGPCRMMDPVIGDLAQQYVGRLRCFKLNTDDSPSIATKYGIRSIPTTMIFVNGEKKDAVVGAVPKTTLSTSIERFL